MSSSSEFHSLCSLFSHRFLSKKGHGVTWSRPFYFLLTTALYYGYDFHFIETPHGVSAEETVLASVSGAVLHDTKAVSGQLLIRDLANFFFSS